MTIDKFSIITSAYKKNFFKIIYKLRFFIFIFPFFTTFATAIKPHVACSDHHSLRIG